MGTDITGYAEYRTTHDRRWSYAGIEVPDVRSYEVFNLFTDYREREHITIHAYDVDDNGEAVMRGIPDDAQDTERRKELIERCNVGQTWYSLDEIKRPELWVQIQDPHARRWWAAFLAYLEELRISWTYSDCEIRVLMGFDN